MANKNDLKNKMQGGISGLFQSTIGTNTPQNNKEDAPTVTKRVHCNFVMNGDIHRRMKLTAMQKGITLISALEQACEMYLKDNEC